MRKALFFLHYPSEGPGLLAEGLRRLGWEVVERPLWSEPPGIPPHTELIILMGGPMSVRDEGQYPFLRPEKEILRPWLASGGPTLGICLGAQLMADALGAKVHRGPQEEIGFFEVELTPEGAADPCFGLFPERFEVFQWHGETFDLPRGAILLAHSELYPHQAFRVGKGAYGLQFHLEVTEGMVREWLEDGGIPEELKRRILEEAPRKLPPLRDLCLKFLEAFLSQAL